MVGNGQRRRSRQTKYLICALACFLFAIYIPFKLFTFAADSRADEIKPGVTKFQFARMQYPGGIPEYIKNWYTDYPAMDQHLTALLRRLTGIDVAPPVIVNPASKDIFKFPLIYSVEPEQRILGPADIANL